MNHEYWASATKSKQGDVENTEVADLVIRTVKRIRDEQSALYERMIMHTGLYLERDISGFYPGEFQSGAADLINDEEVGGEYVSWNVVKACTDAATAKLTLRDTAAKFETELGLDESQEAALDLDQFCRATSRSRDAYRSKRRMVKTAAITGTGLIKVFPRNGEIAIEAVHPSHILVDEQAAINCVAGEMFQHEVVPRNDLLADWPEKCHEGIKKTNEAPGSGLNDHRDMVEVFEAWLLPRGSRKGRHVVCTKDVVLLDEEWKHRRFPFVVVRWGEPEVGWYGLSGVGDIAGCQLELNHVIDILKGNLDHLAISYILSQPGQVKDADLRTNKRFKIIESATPAQVIHPAMAHQQIFEWAERQWSRAFELFGLSQMTATSTKPPGLRSGRALNVYHEIETQRFSDIARQLEHAEVELAYLIIQAAKDLVADGENPTARAQRTRAGFSFFKEIKFGEIKLDDTQYTITVQPTSGLPSTPAGRQQALADLAEAGLVSREEARHLLDMPDLAKYQRLANAARDDLERAFEKMLAGGEYIPPMRYQDLRTGLQLATQYFLRARLDEVAEEKRDNLLNWISDAEAMLAEAQAAMQPPPGAPPPGTPADPQAAMLLGEAAQMNAAGGRPPQ